jgi:phosphomannomutase
MTGSDIQRVLDSIFKAYDIRGTVPEQFNADIARAIGVAFAEFAGEQTVLVARDMRPSGVELAAAFAEGAMSRGVNVIDLGLASTDMLYFAAGSLNAPGAMFTASHNPAQYNGIKFCLSGARPVGADTGLDIVRERTARELASPSPSVAVKGSSSSRNVLDAFADHVVGFVDAKNLRPLKVVADTANGMGGLVVPAVCPR